jgi:hypothetical protein
MRRLYLMMVLAILIQACAGMSAKTPAPIPTAMATYTLINTLAPPSTPSLTPSPTIVHIPTVDPNQPTVTFVPIPIYIGKNTATPLAPLVFPTPTKPGPGFLSVLISEKKIQWGSCKPNKTKILAQVENPEDVYSVIIFVQVKSAIKEDYTPWTNGDTMERHSDGTFSYLLNANTTRGHNHYKNSFVRFQLVATNTMGEEIGRTQIFTNEISLSPCM